MDTEQVDGVVLLPVVGAAPAAARWYLASRALGLGGESLVLTMLPLLTVLLFEGGPVEVALVYLARQGVNLIGSFPLAVLIDRRGDRLGIQVAALLTSAALVGAAPLLWLLGALTFPLLLAGAAVFFVCGTVVTTSGYGLVNQLTAPGTRVAYSGRLTSARSVSEVSGQSAGPALLRFVPGPVALLAGAVLALVSALSLLPVRRHLRDRPAATPGPATAATAATAATGRRLVAHVRATVSSLRAVAAVVVRRPDLTVLWVGGAGAAITAPILVVYAVSGLHVSVTAFGLLTAAGAGGGIVGGLVTGRLCSWLAPLPLVGLCAVVAAAAVPVLTLGELLPHARVLAYVGVAGYEALTAGAGAVMVSVAFGGLQDATAEAELTRTMSVARLGLDLMIVVGLVAGGWVGSSVGSHAVLAAAAVILVLGAAGAFAATVRGGPRSAGAGPPAG